MRSAREGITSVARQLLASWNIFGENFTQLRIETRGVGTEKSPKTVGSEAKKRR